MDALCTEFAAKQTQKINSPVLVVGRGGLPTFLPLDARDESGGREFEETQAEQALHLGPDAFDSISVEPGTVNRYDTIRVSY